MDRPANAESMDLLREQFGDKEIIITHTDPETEAANQSTTNNAPLATYDERGHQMVVRKSNQLIQLPVYKLTLVQQKLMLHIFAMIREDDTELPEYEMSIYEFLKLCNLNTASGSAYRSVKKALEDLVNIKAEWITQPGTACMETFRWVDKVRINPTTGKIHIILDRVLKPYLIQLKSFYTTIPLTFTLPMKSQYSMHMYELLKSYQYSYLKLKQKNKPFVIQIDQLLRQMDAPYKKWTDIRRYILDRAKAEINGHTDIYFDYSVYEKNRRVVSIAVTIEPLSQEEQDKIILQIQSKYSKKAKRKMREMAKDFNKDAKNDHSIWTLSYVSDPESTIPYSVGSNKEEMIKELNARAEIESLKKELSEEELEAVNLIINLMAIAAGTVKGDERCEEGANAKYIEQINDVILYCKSMKKWFAGIAKRYASSIIPLSRTKKDPAAYLNKVIQNDLENFRIYIIQKPVSNENLLVIQGSEISVEAAEAHEVVNDGVSPPLPTDVRIIRYEDASTKKNMVGVLKELMAYDELVKELTSTQLSTLDDSINLVAALCRRNRKGKDDEYIVGKANTQFIDPLNNFIKSRGSLKALFSAIAHEYDYSVFWTEVSKNTKINDPKAFLAYQIEQAVLYPDMNVSQYEAKGQKKESENAFNIGWNKVFDEPDDGNA